MIVGVGTDIVDIRRIENLLNERFISRCFTDSERDYCESKRSGGGHIAAYARRFAAKEACAKALGCGIGAKAGLQDIEVDHDDGGKPGSSFIRCCSRNAYIAYARISFCTSFISF